MAATFVTCIQDASAFQTKVRQRHKRSMDENDNLVVDITPSKDQVKVTRQERILAFSAHPALSSIRQPSASGVYSLTNLRLGGGLNTS